MYRRLIVYGLAVCASALIALVVPLAMAARDIVQATQISQAADTARAITNDWQQTVGRHGDALIPPPTTGIQGTVTLYSPSGKTAGPNPPAADRVVSAALRGSAASEIVDGTGYISAPAYFDDHFGAVLVSLTPAQLNRGLAPRLGALAGVSLVLLIVAASTAWALARRTVAPCAISSAPPTRWPSATWTPGRPTRTSRRSTTSAWHSTGWRCASRNSCARSGSTPPNSPTSCAHP